MMATVEAVTWDARAEHDMAVMIRRYLRENHAPAGSRIAADLEQYAANLHADADARLRDIDARPLRAVS